MVSTWIIGYLLTYEGKGNTYKRPTDLYAEWDGECPGAWTLEDCEETQR